MSVAGYINPFADPRWKPARTDQGVDYMPTVPLPVQAIGAGTVTYSNAQSGWPGGAFLTYQLSEGSHKGEYIFVAEHLTNLLPVGAHVNAGDQLAIAQPGYPWIETGQANPTTDLPLVGYGGAADGTPMPGGLAFARFLRSLGAPTLQDPGAGVDMIGPGAAVVAGTGSTSSSTSSPTSSGTAAVLTSFTGDVANAVIKPFTDWAGAYALRALLVVVGVACVIVGLGRLKADSAANIGLPDHSSSSSPSTPPRSPAREDDDSSSSPAPPSSPAPSRPSEPRHPAGRQAASAAAAGAASAAGSRAVHAVADRRARASS